MTAADPAPVVVIGATSGIGRATAAALARQGHPLVLAGRCQDELQRLCGDLRVRFGILGSVQQVDVRETASHPEAVARMIALAGGRLGGAVVAVGALGEQRAAERDFAEALTVIETNFTGVASLLTPIAAHLESRRGGFIAVVTSVAGDRGRQSNYVYGAAKAGLSTWLEGLRHRLAPAGVPVLTVKPGFVDTEMTFGLPGVALAAAPASVAEAIVRAIRARRSTLYVPWFWRYVMLGIRLLPEPLYARLRI